MSYLKLLNI